MYVFWFGKFNAPRLFKKVLTDIWSDHYFTGLIFSSSGSFYFYNSAARMIINIAAGALPVLKRIPLISSEIANENKGFSEEFYLVPSPEFGI